MFGDEVLEIALNTQSVITTVDEWLNPETSQMEPAIVNGITLPSPEDLPVERKTINYYRYMPIRLGGDVWQSSYAIHCRAHKEKDARAIMEAVITAINRACCYNYSIVCRTMVILPPSSEVDNWNYPVEAIIKTR
jgi:hypothetical protein